MYSGSGFSDWEIGDITVIISGGKYHLFHLIIPNHDYIAHAVSDDGLTWKRVKNALFVGHPGEWDDDMLWTMHVCETSGGFEMFYTGLHRKDRGVVSRIGYAVSDNLLDWEKRTPPYYPIEPKGVFYETASANPRTWLSFRDPFKFEFNGDTYLLVGARTISGPISRRGCVGVVKLGKEKAQLLPPLFFPRMYDDVECPCIFEANARYYLIGSIREDIKVRYWVADSFFGNYKAYSSDILLPFGNYAARIVQDGEQLLVYNFFFTNGKADSLRALPPPKQLAVANDGRLVLKSYFRWNQMRQYSLRQHEFGKVYPVLANHTATMQMQDGSWTFQSESGYELFGFNKPSASFIWEGTLRAGHGGKFGLLTDMDIEGNGYFIGFNAQRHQVSIRSWGFNPLNSKQNFIFSETQSGFYEDSGTGDIHFRLIRFGNYIELSVNTIVILTLIDYTYAGSQLGIYTCSTSVELLNSEIVILPNPPDEYASQEDAQKIS